MNQQCLAHGSTVQSAFRLIARASSGVQSIAPVAMLCLVALILLAGCGGGSSNGSNNGGSQPPTPLSDVALTGTVYGGQAPVVGAHVYLFAANTTGYGGTGIAASSSNASVSLISATETGTSEDRKS